MINDSYRTDVCLHFPPHTIGTYMYVYIYIYIIYIHIYAYMYTVRAIPKLEMDTNSL